jgi:subtilisin family serine protease
MFVDAMMGGTHLRPPDEANEWSKNAWSLNPDLASGLRWGLERIRAPLAWGCETGDSTLKVAVVDYGFQDVADLSANAPGATVFGKWPDEKHGTEVASVLGARGDNGVQMTGVMWRAHLSLFDPSRRNNKGKVEIGLRSMAENIVEAGKSANIINYSGGLYWLRDKGRLPYTQYIDEENNPAKDSAEVSDAHMAILAALFDLESNHNRRPLIVISASNDGIDAYWSGVANVAADPEFRDRVIIVGSSNAMDDRSSHSNYNITTNLVSVMAPGESVGALNHTGEIVPASGTSVAAPFVTGLAGLLKSFDPRLTAEELKELIVAGAESSGRSAHGVPIIDAYESLKLAARRPGAPLCGNRLWMDNGKMKARRGQAVENLFTVPGGARDVMALHGGRRIQLYDNGQRDRRDWQLNGTSWTEMADPPPLEMPEIR